MSTGLDRNEGSDPRAGTARDEKTNFKADPEGLALADPREEAIATTYRVTLWGPEMDVEPIQGYARGLDDIDALRRVDPSTIPADLANVDAVGMIDYRTGPTPDEEG